MEQGQSVAPQVVPAEQAPVVEHFGGTGPNEFEQQYHAMSAAIQSANASDEESGPALVQPGTPQGSPGDGATNATDGDSFLSPEEEGRFDTNSPEYKAMQASFTKRMQALAAKERELEAKLQPEARDPAIPSQAPPPFVPDYSGFKSTAELKPEFEDYRDNVIRVAQEVAQYTLSQVENYNQVVAQHQQRAEGTAKIQRELQAIQSGPRAAEFNRHFEQVKAIAVESPTLLSAVGLGGILNMITGAQGSPPAQAENGNGSYSQGVQDTLNRMTSRKQAATYQPAQSPAGTTVAQVPQFKPGISMSDAVAQAFHAAKAKHSR